MTTLLNYIFSEKTEKFITVILLSSLVLLLSVLLIGLINN